MTDKPLSSVEIIPPVPLMIEFIGKQQTRGFPIQHLRHFVLGPNPEHGGIVKTPPEQLILNFPTADVTLIGFRLDLILEPLRTGRVARITALEADELVVAEPVVTTIRIRERKINPPATRKLNHV